jgi:hypothetical protein
MPLVNFSELALGWGQAGARLRLHFFKKGVELPYLCDKLPRRPEGGNPMNVWVELQNGTKQTYTHVKRIVERGGKVEIRGGTGLEEKLLVVHDKAQIKNLGNSTVLPPSRIQKVF